MLYKHQKKRPVETWILNKEIILSHFVKCKTEVKDLNLLKKALDHLGWKFTEGNFKVSQYGTTEKAEILLAKDNNESDRNAVGLSMQEDGTWAMVGDPYHAPYDHPLRKYYNRNKQFANDLGLAYAIVEAKERLEENGFEAVDNDAAVVGPDGKIRMLYQKVMG